MVSSALLGFGGCDGFMNTLATANDQGGGSGVLELGQLNRVAEHRYGNVRTVPAVATYCAPNPSAGDRRKPLILLGWRSGVSSVLGTGIVYRDDSVCVSIQVYYI